MCTCVCVRPYSFSHLERTGTRPQLERTSTRPQRPRVLPGPMRIFPCDSEINKQRGWCRMTGDCGPNTRRMSRVHSLETIHYLALPPRGSWCVCVPCDSSFSFFSFLCLSFIGNRLVFLLRHSLKVTGPALPSLCVAHATFLVLHFFTQCCSMRHLYSETSLSK